MWLKHHSWQQLFCTESLQVKICVATIVICFLGHPVEMLPLLAAPLVYVLSTVQFFCVYKCAKRIIWQKTCGWWAIIHECMDRDTWCL